MEWACANGFHNFDFGLTHFPNRGLRDFKRRWAAPRGGSLPLGRRGVSPPAPFGRRPARASARSRRSARTASGCAGASGSSYTSMPPDRAAFTAPSAHRQSTSAPPCRTATPAGARRSDSHILPRFPVLSQTFVLTEWSRTRQRFRTELASLFAEKTQVIHPLSAEASPHVHFVPLLCAETLFGNLALLARRPRLYLRTFMRVVNGSYRRPAGGSLKRRPCLRQGRGACTARRAPWRAARPRTFIHHPATAAWAIHRLTGVSFSVTAHADDLFVGPALLRDKVSAAAFVATISEHNRSFLERLVPGAGRIEVVRCGVDPRLLPYREAEEPSAHRLCREARAEEGSPRPLARDRARQGGPPRTVA